MRAVFIPESSIDMSKKNLEVTGKNAHHLISVARIKKGEDILILNGKGIKTFAKVLQVEKKEVILSLLKQQKCLPENNMDIVAGVTKKDSFEKIIRICVELGIQRLFPLYTQFSQRNFKHTDRISKLMENAMIQSNNPFLLQIMPARHFNEIDKIAKEYQHLFYFSSRSHPSTVSMVKKENRVLIFIGPEGGLSLAEEEKLKESSWKFIHLPTCILRSPTAVAAAAGYAMAKTNGKRRPD